MKRVVSRQIPTPYLPEPDAAAYLGMKSGRTLQNSRWRGTGPKFLKQGRRVIYRIEDLDAWMNAKDVLKQSTGDSGVTLADEDA